MLDTQSFQTGSSDDHKSAQWHRTYEKVAKTPYERLPESDAVSKKEKAKLKAIHTTLDPLSLQIKLAALKEALRKNVSKLSKK